MFKNIRIGVRLTVSFFVLAILSSSVIGYIAYDNAKTALQKESFDKLTAVREMKSAQIEAYFDRTYEEIQLMSMDPNVINAMRDFPIAFELANTEINRSLDRYSGMDQHFTNYLEKEFIPRLDKNLIAHAETKDETTTDFRALVLQDLYIAKNPFPIGQKDELRSSAGALSYDGYHEYYHPIFRNYLQTFGYYDIFLVDHKTGNIVYTVYKEVDFATSLTDGPFSNTNIAHVFEKAKNSEVRGTFYIEDYEPYHPSYNQNAAFIATPVFDGTEKIGVLICQIPINKIDDIMTSNQHWEDVGLGSSGETYIVGGDTTLRNQSRFLIEDSLNYFNMIKSIGLPELTIQQIRNFNSTVGLQTVKTPGTIAALQGKTDTQIFEDYRGVPVLSSFKPLKINGVNWVIMSEIDKSEAFSHVNRLRNSIFIVFGVLVVIVLVMAYFSSRTMTRPIKKLTTGARQLAKGNWDAVIDIQRKDEIGILASSFKKMQIAIKNLISELKHINANLENKVKERTREIEEQKEIVEKKQEQITDSIQYARRLQAAILPPLEYVQGFFKDFFILYRPKDIVSGDFYWMHDHELEDGSKEVLIAAVDCTGHGVPGAMVSVVGSNGLHRCVEEFGLTKPSDILEKLTDIVIKTFETSGHEVKDGMDIALVRINLKTLKLEYAGANNPLWVLHEGDEELEIIKANKQPIGKFHARHPFDNHEVQLKKGDSLYIFTDGFPDQFGGPKNKKYGYKRFRNKLAELRDYSMPQHENLLTNEFEEWKMWDKQIDDVCVIGIRV